MLKEEFMGLTGFEPSDEDYSEIEKQYYDFDGDKTQFCKEWIKNGVQTLYNKAIKTNEEYLSEIAGLKDKIQSLKADLDKELQWKDACNIGTKMTNYDYVMLYSDHNSKFLTDLEAKELINREVGFELDAIQIIGEVEHYEVNKYGVTRVNQTAERVPIFNASDWNYVRFDVKGREYELINSDLFEY